MVLVRLAFPLCLTFTLLRAGFVEPGIVRASPASASSEDSRIGPIEAKPFIVERRQMGDGPKDGPWLRFELRFGEPREKNVEHGVLKREAKPMGTQCSI
jgi:hypothetical protein